MTETSRDRRRWPAYVFGGVVVGTALYHWQTVPGGDWHVLAMVTLGLGVPFSSEVSRVVRARHGDTEEHLTP